MATLVSETPEVESHYLTQAALTAALMAQLRALWPSVEPLSSAAAWVEYGKGVHALTDRFSVASISMAADYYDDLRDRAGVVAPYRQRIIEPPPRALVDAGLDWAKSAQAQMDATVVDIQRRVEAAMQKAVTDSGRDQTLEAVAGDEAALGFARVAKPGACYFCLAQAFRKTRPRKGQPARYGVYKSRGSAGVFANDDFTGAGPAKFHNNCQCQIVAIFTPDFEVSPAVAAAEALYTESTVNSKRGEAMNDFRRALAVQRAGGSAPALDEPAGSPALVDGRTAMRDLLARLAQ